jgi:Zn-dependent protease
MLDIDLAVSIKRLSVAFVPLMLGIILHEVAHGWAALKRGDPTAAMLGRLTLNPVPHIDPMGLFVFVLTSLTSSSAGPNRYPSIPGISGTS